MKKKYYLSLCVISSLIPISIVSCSNNSKKDDIIDNNHENVISNFQKEIDNFFKQKKIQVEWAYPIVTENIFNKYKNNLNELKNIFNLKNNTNKFDLTFTIDKVITKSNNKIMLEIQILDNTNKNNKATQIIELNSRFSTNQEYVDSIYELLSSKITIKKEFENQDLFNMFSLNKNISLNEFAEKYFYIPKFLGVQIKIDIPSQLINFNNKFKINPLIYFEENLEKPLIPSQPRQLYLPLKNSQINVVTILKQSDINKNQNIINSILNQNVLGKLFFFKDEESDELNINYSFANKSIYLEIDFSKFKQINFKEQASFQNNSITKVIFSNDSLVNNLKANLFKQNNIKEINLPNTIEEFNISSFDPHVIIKGIYSISLVNRLYDKENNDLYLNRAKDKNEIDLILTYINKIQTRNKLFINKIYLPNFSFTGEYDLECNEIIFNSEIDENNKYEIFESNISKWSIKKDIIIPETVIRIKKDSFNSKLINENKIKRLLNKKTLELIKEQKLNLNTTLIFDENIKYNLLDNSHLLDEFFYTFSSVDGLVNNLQQIFINPNNENEYVWKNSNFGNNINFFKSSSASNKEIYISSDFLAIENSQNYNYLVDELTKSGIKLNRKFNQNFSFIKNNNLIIKELYKFNDLLFEQKGLKIILNKYLVGYEHLISNIDFSNIDVVHEKLFENIIFKNEITVNLSTIKKVKENAFYGTKNLKFNVMNFSPIEIDDYAFYMQKINSSIDFSQTIKIGNYGFYNSNLLNELNLNKINVIGRFAFYNNSNIKKLILSNELKAISDSCFYNCGITSLDLKNVETIGSNTFYGNKINGEINLIKVLKIGRGAFQGNEQNINQIIGINLDKIEISNIFNNKDIYKIKIQKDEQYMNKIIGYNDVLNEFNWENISIESIEFKNYFNLFLNKRPNRDLTIKKVVLPNNSNFSNSILSYLEQIKKIEKLVWNSPNKNLNFSLTKLKGKLIALDENFLTGMETITENCFANLELKNESISLSGVKYIKGKAFLNSGIKTFIETDDLSSIENQSFDNDVNMKLPPNLKLKNNSFSLQNILPTGVKRDIIFSNQYKRIYDQETKILDFTKTNIISYDSEEKWMEYKNISQYLLNGDVKKIVLPPLYILKKGFVDNLGDVESIEFQNQNQQISKFTFEGTNIIKKPNQTSTNIIYDDDNFFNN